MEFIEDMIQPDIQKEKDKIRLEFSEKSVKERKREINRIDAKKVRLKMMLLEYLHLKCIAHLEDEISIRKLQLTKGAFEEFRDSKRRKLSV